MTKLNPPSQLNGTVSPEKVSPCSTTFLHCQKGHVIDTNIGTVKSLRLVAVLDRATRRYNLMPRDVRSSGLCRPGAFSQRLSSKMLSLTIKLSLLIFTYNLFILRYSPFHRNIPIDSYTKLVFFLFDRLLVSIIIIHASVSFLSRMHSQLRLSGPAVL